MDFFTTSVDQIFEEENIANNIFSFLGKKELALLSCCNQQLNQQIKQIKSQDLFQELEEWKNNILKQYHKQNSKKNQSNNNNNNGSKKQNNNNSNNNNQHFKLIQTQQNTILKIKYVKIPSKFFQSKLWRQIDTDLNSGKGKELRQKIRDDKFIIENNNIFFENVQTGDIMFMNRSLLDENLNFENQDFESEVSEENKYEKLYQNNSEFSVDQFDFSNMQSLLKRQKNIIQDMAKKQKTVEELQKVENSINSMQNLNQVTLILCCGGYFTLAVYDKNGNCFLHKSDHKYVVRKKAGQRQLAKDKNAGSSIKSMGSQIRRDQEKHHQINVQNILNENFDVIEKSDIIFLQAPGINKLMLVSENEPLFKLKHKLRSMCLTSKKANYTENERLYKAISKVYFVFNKNIGLKNQFEQQKETEKQFEKNINKQQQQQDQEEEEEQNIEF